MQLRTILSLISRVAVIAMLSGCGNSQKAGNSLPTAIPAISPQLQATSIAPPAQKPSQVVPTPILKPKLDVSAVLGSGLPTIPGSWFVVGFLPWVDYYDWPSQLYKANLYLAERIAAGVNSGEPGDKLDNRLRFLLDLKGKPILQVSSDMSFLITMGGQSARGFTRLNNTSVDIVFQSEGKESTCQAPILGNRLVVFPCLGNGVFILGREPKVDIEKLEKYFTSGSDGFGGRGWTMVGANARPNAANSVQGVSLAERARLIDEFQKASAQYRLRERLTLWWYELLDSFMLFDDGSAMVPQSMINPNLALDPVSVAWELVGSKLRLTGRTIDRNRPEFDGKTWALQCDYLTVGKELTLLCNTLSDPQDNSWFRGALFLFSAR